jgi:hypothetical protein
MTSPVVFCMCLKVAVSLQYKRVDEGYLETKFWTKYIVITNYISDYKQESLRK